MHTFVQEPHRESLDFKTVEQIAVALRAHMEEPAIAASIRAANSPGRSSAGIQAVLLPFLRAQGFADESKGLFAGYHTSAVRPDYFRRVGTSGILLEVERGKTTINNMDFLDF